MSESGETSTVDRWLADFKAAWSTDDDLGLGTLFAEPCFWRDVVAFTWDIRTIEGAEVVEHLAALSAKAFASTWQRVPSPFDTDDTALVAFETELGRGHGIVRLASGRCLMLFTCLDELKGHEERRGERRPLGDEPDALRPETNWKDALELERSELGRDRQPYVLIVGGGQGGLSLAARLRQLDVPVIVVDRYPNIGDQWRSRYKSLLLHDPVWYDHMPYLPFPDTWPVFTPKDKIADWLEAYSRIMELNVWCGTECEAASFDDDRQEWTVKVRRGGVATTLHPRHLVIATGNAGRPNLPSFEGQELFGGAILHSSQYHGGEAFVGQRVVVIGSNNSAQDICADLVQHDVDTTMVQRSSTHIIRQQTMIETMTAPLYSEQAVAAGVSTELADLVKESVPLRLLPTVMKPATDEVARRDAAYYRRLEATGFMHDFGEDGTGMMLMYLRRAAGYYIDVGAVELLVSGRIKLKSRVSIDRLDATGVVLSDGTHLPADTVVCATGYGTMDQIVEDLISPAVASKIGKVWGYGSGTAGDPGPWEGELRNMWKPTRQNGLWFHGGNFAQTRFFSRALALQLKARFEGLPIGGAVSDHDPRESMSTDAVDGQ